MSRGEPERFRTYLHAPLHIGQETDGRVITMMPVGLLSTSNASQLRDALLKCVADQPTAIVVDLALLRVHQIYALSIFAWSRGRRRCGPEYRCCWSRGTTWNASFSPGR
ncbi:STAS domain-containing protein [Kribbella voronezhensis]|uniref:STAS domain-containing protein n=1 Tax=Kribbella voronezhensis TaxID=2512212 RepID=UPI0010632909|nr:hypothetical protein [Kribbella voronezhensis]